MKKNNAESAEREPEITCYFRQYREHLSAWDVIRACTEFRRDHPEKMPEDMTDVAAIGKMGERVAELYTDLLDAHANGELSILLDEMRAFVEGDSLYDNKEARDGGRSDPELESGLSGPDERQ